MLRSTAIGRVRPIVLVLLIGLLVQTLGPVSGRLPQTRAQTSCQAETEPNDQPPEAMPLGGTGCVEGTAGAGDQDFFSWTVAGATHRWSVTVGGIPNLLVTFNLYRVDPNDPSNPAAVGNVSSPGPGEDATSPLLLLAPGDYLIGLAASDTGSYRLTVADAGALPPNGDAEPNDAADSPTAVDAVFALSGDLQGSDDWYAWTISGDEAATHWDLSLQVPLGESASLVVETADQQQVADLSTDPFGRALLASLGLSAGTYFVHVSPAKDHPVAYLLGASAGSARSADQEDEPNDDVATAFPFDPSLSVYGHISRDGDRDVYRLHVDAALAASRFDLTLTATPGLDRTLCLLGEEGQEVVCRQLKTGIVALSGLTLPEGDVFIEVKGTAAADDEYSIDVLVTGAPEPGRESEPNDNVALATPLKPGDSARGHVDANDADFYRVSIDGEPQLWRVEVLGEANVTVALLNAAGQTESDSSYTGTARAQISDLFLLPGDHWLRVRGDDGDYTLQMVPLGPPDPNAEREPNNSNEYAQLLSFGQPLTGRLAEQSDVDVYRFFIGAEDHVALTLTPPSDGAITFSLNWGGVNRIAGGSAPAGTPLTYEAVLQPGDYVVDLHPDQPSDVPYRLDLERLDPFVLPADLEPNDDRATARPLPDTLSASGTVGQFNDADWFQIPARDRDTAVTIFYQGTGSLSLYDGETPLPFESAIAGDGTTLTGTLPAGVPVFVQVGGTGSYSFTVSVAGSFGLHLPPSALPVTLALDTGDQRVAAYVEDGQRIDATMKLSNQGSDPLDLTLDGQTSHYGWHVDLAQPTLSLPAGGTTTVGVTIGIDPDAWADRSVRISLRARDAAGSQATTFAELTPDRDAPPLNPTRVWPVPDAMLGGLDVAWTALGAAPVDSGGLTADVEAEAFDGMTPAGGGIHGDASAFPVTLAVDLAGDDPVPIAGVLIDPQGGDGVPADRPREFDVLVSTDGVNYQTVLSGVLSPLPIEQAFALPAPIPATFAQLQIRSNYGGSRIVIGEWKVVAQPGWRPADAATFNVADPTTGGHVVWADPQFSDPSYPKDLLTEGGSTVRQTIKSGATVSWVVGFHDDRAALISQVEWVDPADTRTEARLNSVKVEVSTESPIGPWQSLGTWKLKRDASGAVAPFTLDAPVWGRFVRFTGRGPKGQDTDLEYPATLRIIDVASGDDQRSILGEWGHYGQAAIYETQTAPPAAARDDETTPNDTADQAQQIALGTTVDGRVQAQRDEDWYLVGVPSGQNTLSLTIHGDPVVAVEVTLQDEGGADVPLTRTNPERGMTVLTAQVAPGQSYLVHVVQPSHAVSITYDTSASIGPYTATVYQALLRFAGDVVAGQEVVNFLPFGGDFLLKTWGDQAYVLQGFVNSYPQDASSSSAEEALLKSSQALADRPGGRAIVVITDAETSSYDQTQKMWQALDAVAPRIFAVHIGSGADPASQELMQDWANVDNGDYVYVTTLGEMDVAFDRATTRLRRPVGYDLTAEATFATPAPTPTPTPAPTATPAVPPKPGSIQVLPPKAAGAGEPTPAAPVAAGVTVELILDTSGSMLEAFGDGTRFSTAKGVLTSLVTDTLPAGTNVALRTFGSEPGSCDTNLLVPFGPLDPAAMAGTIASIPEVDMVNTPIGASLKAAAKDLKKVKGPKIIVLVTDGEETCDGDPEAAIRSLAKQGIDVHVNIVGLAIDDETLKQQFEDYARIGNGQYFDAGNADELGAAVEKAVAAPFQVLDADGKVIATGVVGGPAVKVPAGTYTVQVESEPPRTFENVEVRPGKRKRLQL